MNDWREKGFASSTRFPAATDHCRLHRRLGYRSVWQINNNTSRTRVGGLGIKLNHQLARWAQDLLLPASDFIAANWRASGVPMRTIRNAAIPQFESPSGPPMKGPLKCVVAGRLEASKGHHVAVDAVPNARAGCDVMLDVFGGPLDDSPYADDLRRKIAAAGIEPAVRLMGFCSNFANDIETITSDCSAESIRSRVVCGFAKRLSTVCL